jgi:hypothetical protein
MTSLLRQSLDVKAAEVAGVRGRQPPCPAALPQGGRSCPHLVSRGGSTALHPPCRRSLGRRRTRHLEHAAQPPLDRASHAMLAGMCARLAPVRAWQRDLDSAAHAHRPPSERRTRRRSLPRRALRAEAHGSARAHTCRHKNPLKFLHRPSDHAASPWSSLKTWK